MKPTAFFRYQKRHFLRLLLYFLMFFLAFFLYHLPIRAVAYPFLLCCLLELLFTFLDYGREKEKHRILQNCGPDPDCRLPETDSLAEEDYRELVKALWDTQQQNSAKAAKEYQNMVDYYTTWVHQIKTPIASMTLKLQSEDTPFARSLQGDLGRIDQYVDMVLTFLRLNADSTDYVIQKCDLDAIVRQSVRRFAGEFIDRKLSLRYDPLNVSVLTDEKWLGFVIDQVLSNALKYTPSGSVSIYLQEPCTLCIEDTGIGIAPEDLPRIFENGFTGFHGRAHRKASGIGLYLCKRICGSLGHTISARSMPGKGTTISICLDTKTLEVE